MTDREGGLLCKRAAAVTFDEDPPLAGVMDRGRGKGSEESSSGCCCSGLVIDQAAKGKRSPAQICDVITKIDGYFNLTREVVD